MARYRLLLTPVQYLRVQSDELRIFQWHLPTVIAVLALAGYYALPVPPPILSSNGLVASFSGMLNTLVGFYIAALAAIATFRADNLDQPLKGQAAIIRRSREGKTFNEALTRRRFLVTLFGYCSFVSILLYGMGVIANLLAPSLPLTVEVRFAKGVWLLAYFWLSASLLMTTLLAMHYLIDRMHRD